MADETQQVLRSYLGTGSTWPSTPDEQARVIDALRRIQSAGDAAPAGERADYDAFLNRYGATPIGRGLRTATMGASEWLASERWPDADMGGQKVKDFKPGVNPIGWAIKGAVQGGPYQKGEISFANRLAEELTPNQTMAADLLFPGAILGKIARYLKIGGTASSASPSGTPPPQPPPPAPPSQGQPGLPMSSQPSPVQPAAQPTGPATGSKQWLRQQDDAQMTRPETGADMQYGFEGLKPNRIRVQAGSKPADAAFMEALARKLLGK